MSSYFFTNNVPKYENYLQSFKKSKNCYKLLLDYYKSTDDFSTINPDDYLIDVFKYYNYFETCDQNYSGIDENSCLLTKNHSHHTKKYTVCDQDTFVTRFNKLTNNILNFFDWNNVVIAGGVVNIALSNTPLPIDLETLNYDIDVFIYGVNEGEAKKIMTRIYDSIKDIIPESKCVKTDNAVTVIMPKPFRHIQFVTTLYQNKGDILCGFDLQSSKVLYDGKTVYTTIDGHFGLMFNTNIYSSTIDNYAYGSRLSKYAKRGYCVFVPNFDKQMISNYVYKISLQSENVNQLVKLLHTDKFGKNGSEMSVDNAYYLDDIHFYKSRISGYNAILFTRNESVDVILTNLRQVTTKMLYGMKLRPLNEGTTKFNRTFKKHDIDKFPMYCVFDNIKLALVHENNYSEDLVGKFFLNGPTFKKSLYYLKNLNNATVQNDAFKEYSSKYGFTADNYDNLYYRKDVSDNIKLLLNGEPCKISTMGRDELGRTYMQAAIMVNNVNLVKQLLGVNYDIYERIDEGMTTMHFAIKKNKHEIVELLVDRMIKDGNTTIKYYENGNCNLIHYCIMYSDIAMFNILMTKLSIPFSDISWSVKFNNDERKKFGRVSKYICCAKFCMMFNKLDIMTAILEKYKDYNDFRYIFVDSDLTVSNTSNIIEYAVNTNNNTALVEILNFFVEKNIDICYDYTKCKSGTELNTVFTLEYYLRNNVKLAQIMAQKITHLLGTLHSKRQYNQVLQYVQEYVPNVWTKEIYADIHRQIEFYNVFGNKYVDTDKGLQLFAAIISKDWNKINLIDKELQYGLYIYDPRDSTTVLSLCKNDTEMLQNVLNHLGVDVKNKTGSYVRNITNLLALDYTILFNVDQLRTLLLHDVHGQNVRNHVHKYVPEILRNVFNSSNSDGDFLKFTELLVLLTETVYNEKIPQFDNNKLEHLMLLKPSFKNLEKYMKLINGMRYDCDHELLNIFDYKNFSLEFYISDMCNSIDTFLLIYPDLSDRMFLIDKKYNLLENKKTAFKILDLYKFDQMKHYDVIADSMTWNVNSYRNFVEYLDDRGLTNKLIKTTNFDNVVHNAVENKHYFRIKNMFKNESFDQLATDVNGNTLLHSVIIKNISLISNIINDIKPNTVMNNFGKTVIDYAENSLNNTSKYNLAELSTNGELLIQLRNVCC
mgnify:CR=1 FL=1